MDNAKYRRTNPFSTPKPHKMGKNQDIEELVQNKISFDKHGTVHELQSI